MGKKYFDKKHYKKFVNIIPIIAVLVGMVIGPIMLYGQEQEYSPKNKEAMIQQDKELKESNVENSNDTKTQEYTQEQKAIIEKQNKEQEQQFNTTVQDQEESIMQQSNAQNPDDPLPGQWLQKNRDAQVDTTSGALTYQYPIMTPPGYNGFAPQHALSYSSNNKSHESMFGIGWNIDIPYIQRVNKVGVEKLYTHDYFTSSLDGELIDQGNGVFTPRVEQGQFLQYEYANNSWKVTDKQGVEYIFGLNPQAQHVDPNNSTHIFTWFLESTTDLHGNTIEYFYTTHNNQVYPHQIQYGPNGFFTIEFTTAPRTKNDSKTFYRGFEVETQYEITNIAVKINNTLTQEYNLSYSNGFLQSINHTGYDISGDAQSLPPTIFEYESVNNQNTFTKNTNLPLTDGGHYFDPRYSMFGDFNGDGLTDAYARPHYKISYGPTDIHGGLWLNNGDGTWSKALGLPLTDQGYYFQSKYATVADFNNDGLADIYARASNSAIYNQNDPDGGLWLNNGDGTWSKTPNLPLTDNGKYFDPKYAIFADMNGDGLIDAYTRPSNTAVYNANHVDGGLWLNQGNNTWVKSPTLPITDGGKYFDPKHAIFADFTGDGLVDAYTRPSNTAQYDPAHVDGGLWRNNGDGTWTKTVSAPITDGGKYFESKYSILADFNGDALLDIYARPSNTVLYTPADLHGGLWLNQGNSTWIKSSTLPLTDNNQYFRSKYVTSTDINGDGAVDVYARETGGLLYSPTDQTGGLWLSDNSVFANLTGITNYYGGITNITYTTAQTQNNSHNAPATAMVVESIAIDDGVHPVATTTYEYTGGSFYAQTPIDKKFAGFETVIQTNPDGSIITTKYHQANGETGNEPIDSYAKIGKPYEQTIEDTNQNLFKRTRTQYVENTLGNNAYSILKSSELVQQFDGNSTSTDTAIAYTYDMYGNVTQEIQYGVVSGNADGSFTDIQNDKRKIQTQYASNIGGYAVGYPLQITHKNNTNNKESQIRYQYDTAANIIKEKRWINGSNYAQTQYTYNANGMVLSETDPLGNVTAFTYGAHGLYPQAITNALGHITSFVYNYAIGKPISTTNPNGSQTVVSYDGLGRQIQQQKTQTNGTLQTTQSYSYGTGVSPQQIVSRTHYSDVNVKESIQYIDGLGRVIQQKTHDDNGWITTDTVYNQMQNIQTTTLPYYTANTLYSAPTTNTNLQSSHTYDVLGRATNVTNAYGTTSYVYNGFETAQTDPLGNIKTITNDSFGNIIQIKEHNNGAIYTTHYQYNTQNNLTHIQDAEGNIRTIAYDGLGRRVMLEDLHNQYDTNYGVWVSLYDEHNLVRTIDPNQNEIAYTYDALNRLLTENDTSTQVIETAYTYDACILGTGLVCTITTPNTTTTYTYNLQGLPQVQNVTVDAVQYSVETQYDYQQNPTHIQYPNSTAVMFEYDQQGLPANTYANGQHIATVLYGVHGKPTNIERANGVTTELVYNDQRLYELQSITTNDPLGMQLQNNTYMYDNVGNIVSITDSSQTNTAQQQVFTYDDLYRLTNITTTNPVSGNPYAQTFAYNSIGNITDMNGVVMQYQQIGYANPHAVTSVNGATYTYDKNGNALDTSGWKHKWDAKNRLVQSSNGTDVVVYEYNHNNDRIKKVEGLVSTVYPFAQYEKTNADEKVYVTMGALPIATIENNATQYLLANHLNSTTVVLDQNANIVQEIDYYPFGETRFDIGTAQEDTQFTGYKKDTTTNLHYAGARYYDAIIGRFLSQDPVNLRLGLDKNKAKRFIIDPQKLNTYAYSKNNPVMFIDPDGEEPVKAYTGRIEDLLNVLNNSPSKVGQSDGANYLSIVGRYQVSGRYPFLYTLSLNRLQIM